MSWIAQDRTQLAEHRILDAAADLFADQGVAPVDMVQIAAAAGCSRATLYRYFPDRETLHLAFIQREAQRIGRQVADEIADAPDRVASAILSAVRHVRDNPALHAWFTTDQAGRSVGLAASSQSIESIGTQLAQGDEDGRWLVRAVISLLTMPGSDQVEERRIAATFARSLTSRV